MSSGRCPLKCNCNHNLSRRQFIRGSAGLVAGPVLLQGCCRAVIL
ncbi:MAG: twin-arginine translocation signal domain-containing protein [Candidatus Hermodarchaeia archaeon]